MNFRALPFYLIYGFFLLSLLSCKKRDNTGAFYYWKSTFSLNSAQIKMLNEVGANKIYIRFFDINWDSQASKAYPNAVISFGQTVTHLNITPVIYITNKAFENISSKGIDSLAINSNKLIEQLAFLHRIKYNSIQFDCDWTIATKEKYFYFLSAFKKINHHSLQATIRLHQIKYKGLTGVPPVDIGVLMFYNMGKPNIADGESNSIYNEADAAKYINYIKGYPLNLDVALPLFSWALQIRDHRVIQVYEKIKKAQLNNTTLFMQNGANYLAKKSFFLNGIYIKESDIFKLEETNINTLKKAAQQLAGSLPQQNNRTIIYYELANLDLSEFNAEQLQKISADF